MVRRLRGFTPRDKTVQLPSGASAAILRYVSIARWNVFWRLVTPGARSSANETGQMCLFDGRTQQRTGRVRDGCADRFAGASISGADDRRAGAATSAEDIPAGDSRRIARSRRGARRKLNGLFSGVNPPQAVAPYFIPKG